MRPKTWDDDFGGKNLNQSYLVHRVGLEGAYCPAVSPSTEKVVKENGFRN